MSSVTLPSTNPTVQENIQGVILIYGIGIMFHATLSIVVQKIAGKFFKEDSYLPLLSSFCLVFIVFRWGVTQLQVSFFLLCITYIVVSIVASIRGNSIRGNRTVETPLHGYMTDMVAEAKEGVYSSKIGYEESVKKVEILMNTKKKSNALLVGEPGVGKTTIAEIIAFKIAKDLYPANSFFAKAKLIQVEFSSLLAGTKFVGTIEERIKEMIMLAKADPRIIYFIDEIDLLVGGGRVMDSNVDVSRLLYSAMARGDIRILGAATFEDYLKNIKPKRAFARRLPPVVIDEPSQPQCFEMLRHNYQQISKESRIKISDQAIAAAIVFSGRIRDLHYPDKAVDLIEHALSRVALENSSDEDDENPQNSIIIDIRQIAISGLMLMNLEPSKFVERAVMIYKTFIIQNPDYFPGLIDGDSLWVAVVENEEIAQ